MTTQTTKFVLAAASVILLVHLGGSVYALTERIIDFSTFIAAVGIPLGVIGGWVGKVLTLPAVEKVTT